MRMMTGADMSSISSTLESQQSRSVPDANDERFTQFATTSTDQPSRRWSAQTRTRVFSCTWRFHHEYAVYQAHLQHATAVPVSASASRTRRPRSLTITAACKGSTTSVGSTTYANGRETDIGPRDSASRSRQVSSCFVWRTSGACPTL